MTPTPQSLRELASLVVREVAELPDRTSSNEWPDMMLVSAEELTGIIETVFATRLESDAGDARNAERYRTLRALAVPFGEWKVSRMTTIDGVSRERQWLHGEVLDGALDIAGSHPEDVSVRACEKREQPNFV